ncbi:MAG: hypothetical protein JXQ87_18290 [Bacteroidia bacterium]
MKSICLILSLFGFALMQSCTNRCCPDETGILENNLELPIDSMPTKYWFKQGGDSILIDFEAYLTDSYFISATYKVECNFYDLPDLETCESFTKVKTYTLIDSISDAIMQFHYCPYHYYDAEHLRVGNKVKLTIGTPSNNDEIKVFENFYVQQDYNSIEEKVTSEINRNKVKSVDYSYEKGLKKLELHEGMVIYAAD